GARGLPDGEGSAPRRLRADEPCSARDGSIARTSRNRLRPDRECPRWESRADGPARAGERGRDLGELLANRGRGRPVRRVLTEGRGEQRRQRDELRTPGERL